MVACKHNIKFGPSSKNIPVSNSYSPDVIVKEQMSDNSHII